MRRLFLSRRSFFVALSTLCVMGTASAGSTIYGAKEGPAIEGYDTVAYFAQGKPTEGKPKITAEWNGATWQFASEENRQKFLAEPERYAPQYGAHCSFAMAHNSLVEGDPHRWKIVDGKLYLNANFLAQKLWEVDIPQKIRDADGNWPGKRRELEVKP